jgi:hypothetical protein
MHGLELAARVEFQRRRRVIRQAARIGERNAPARVRRYRRWARVGIVAMDEKIDAQLNQGALVISPPFLVMAPDLDLQNRINFRFSRPFEQ